jgi:F420-dependent oxidoreductase-like protein
MKLGLQVPMITPGEGQELLGDLFGLIAERAERAGLWSLWVMDHFFPVARPPEVQMLEGWSALAYAAGRTNRIRLGTMVTGMTYRHPGILVKTATTLDVLSHGRAYFGIGAAWHEEEHLGLGVPFPPLAERFARLEETLQMWAGDEHSYTGTYYQLQRPLNTPQAVQKPHPPILIGGGGEKKTLRLVAKYGDACNFFHRFGDKTLSQKLEILREHCEAVGRPYEAIEKTMLHSITLTRDGREGTCSPAQLIEQFAALAELGIDQAIFSLRNEYEVKPFEVLSTLVVPAVEKLAVAGR